MTLNSFILAADSALRTLWAEPRAARPTPTAAGVSLGMSEAERREAAALMRVNHVGEVCAQALYAAQALSTRDPLLRQKFLDAGREEGDHLAWTQERLDELGARPSLLNPVWYAGSYAIGLLAGLRGDGWNLGFVVEKRGLDERPGERGVCGDAPRLYQSRLVDLEEIRERREVPAQLVAGHREAQLVGSEHLDGLDDSAPSDLLWGHMVTSALTVAAGRTDNPIHERERVRFSLLLRLADALVSRHPVA